jgi:hypothetical protein
MRGSFGEQVTWPEEWEKAAQAKTDLFKIIDAMPSVLDILRNMLEGELKRLGKTVDIDKVYINTDPAFPADENRPSGTLWDVTVHCLNNNVSPLTSWAVMECFFCRKRSVSNSKSRCSIPLLSKI